MYIFSVTFYIKEIFYRSFYTAISIFILFIAIINFIDCFLIIGICPFFKLLHLKFIITHITQIFDSVIQLSIFLTSIFNLPFLTYNIISFLSSSLYQNQLETIKYYFFLIIFFWFFSFFITYSIIIYILINFFLFSELVQEILLLYVDVKLQLQTYILWVICVFNSVSFTFSILLLLIFFITVFVSPIQLFTFFILFKKYIVFLFMILNTLILPLDFLLQMFVSFLFFLFIEILFLFSCFLIKS